MQNKKLYIIIPIVVLIVAAAAFIGGRLLNGQAGSLGLLPFGNGGSVTTFAINLTPAPELPTAKPEASGTFVERNDNTLILQTFSMQAGSGGGVIVAAKVEGSGADNGEPSISVDSGNLGPKMEVVVTKETKIYHDVTAINPISASGETTVSIQQAVEAGSLDDLNHQTMITVWGRKNGDRIIADVIAYNNPIMIQK
jgi:hypothetical protein